MFKHLQSFQAPLFAGLALFVFSAHSPSQSSVAKRFGARDPHTCASRKAPTSGAISSAQAAQYFLCGRERDMGNTLYLAANVKIEVAKGRPFNIATDSVSAIDNTQLVYDIRGSFDNYICTSYGNVGGRPGRNCSHFPQPRAKGMCYKDTFGDWNCIFSDPGGLTGEHQVPPPTN